MGSCPCPGPIPRGGVDTSPASPRAPRSTLRVAGEAAARAVASRLVDEYGGRLDSSALARLARSCFSIRSRSSSRRLSGLDIVGAASFMCAQARNSRGHCKQSDRRSRARRPRKQAARRNAEGPTLLCDAGQQSLRALSLESDPLDTATSSRVRYSASPREPVRARPALIQACERRDTAGTVTRRVCPPAGLGAPSRKLSELAISARGASARSPPPRHGVRSQYR